MNEKPEALRLANDLEAFYRLTGEGGMDAQAADELLHQHAEIERLKAENERLFQINRSHEMKLSVRGYEIQIDSLKADNERLREALKLALNSHGRMLMSDPPQDPWKVNRVDEVIRELLQEVPR